MSAQITLDWKKDSTFETQMDGHTVTIDTSKEDGGTQGGGGTQEGGGGKTDSGDVGL